MVFSRTAVREIEDDPAGPGGVGRLGVPFPDQPTLVVALSPRQARKLPTPPTLAAVIIYGASAPIRIHHQAHQVHEEEQDHLDGGDL